MSLHPSPIGPIPEETVRVAQAAFPKGNVYMQLRNVLGSVYEDGHFADLFARRGRPAEAPWRLALVTVMQFAEGLTDRQAAEAVRARIDWKYALALALDDPGFDFSVLSTFRTRLVEGAAEYRLLEVLLERCEARGYLKARGRQRTDSTHVLGALRVLDRVERVAETLRAALNTLAGAAPDWLRAQVAPDWYERYGRRIEEYHLPKGQDARHAYAAQLGRDGQYLLTCLSASETPRTLSQLPAVAVLRAVWEQQFVVAADGQVQLRDPKALPQAMAIVESPYEQEARFATKGGRHWVGYKVHVTETCDPETTLPHLVTHVETTPAPATDVNQLPAIEDALADHGLLPSEHLVDAGYVRARNILASQQRHAIDLIGPVDAVHHWQAQVDGGFAATSFALDWERQVAICPEGHTSLRWTASTGPRDRAMAHVSWDRQDCRHCPSRRRCTRAKDGARTLLLPPRAEFDALTAGRQRQTTDTFRQCYRQRAGIEGTISQAVRRFGMRRARYRGLQKTRLQDVATAAALNVGRIVEWYAGRSRAVTRVSRFARLAAA